ncbi:MAG TPA: hypothetical protein P5526_22585 [Anaerolineae bacterium]|nr:hypothetical protein [Anaerolineales bacterium]HRV94964.1 hypothetical protein [Anaerolineae bacterium]
MAQTIDRVGGASPKLPGVRFGWATYHPSGQVDACGRKDVGQAAEAIGLVGKTSSKLPGA